MYSLKFKTLTIYLCCYIHVQKGGKGRDRDICEYLNKFSFSSFLFGNVKAAPYEYTYQQTPNIFISDIV